jgi:hypothetical protein
VGANLPLPSFLAYTVNLSLTIYFADFFIVRPHIQRGIQTAFLNQRVYTIRDRACSKPCTSGSFSTSPGFIKKLLRNAKPDLDSNERIPLATATSKSHYWRVWTIRHQAFLSLLNMCISSVTIQLQKCGSSVGIISVALFVGADHPPPGFLSLLETCISSVTSQLQKCGNSIGIASAASSESVEESSLLFNLEADLVEWSVYIFIGFLY